MTHKPMTRREIWFMIVATIVLYRIMETFVAAFLTHYARS